MINIYNKCIFSLAIKNASGFGSNKYFLSTGFVPLFILIYESSGSLAFLPFNSKKKKRCFMLDARGLNVLLPLKDGTFSIQRNFFSSFLLPRPNST